MPAELNAILPPDRIRRMREQGLWVDRLIVDYLDDNLAAIPDRVAITDRNSMTGRSTTLSYRQLARLSNRIALGLVRLGVEPGDIVAMQLANWWQLAAIHLACVRIGAITNPLMPIFREHELSFMLSFAQSKVFIVPREFRGHDHAAMAESLLPDLPGLEHVFVIGGEGPRSFESHFIERRWEDEIDAGPIFAARRPDPNDVIELQYTSGTTGQPKGVLHTANTLIGNIRPYIETLGLSDRDVVLMASPMAHQTGFLYGMLLPIVLGTRAVLQDIWDPEIAARLIHDEGVTFTMASTPFLADLAGTDAWDSYSCDSLETFVAAGAPIPRVLVQTATQRLGAAILSGWGMTENGLVTVARRDDAPERIYETDGGAVRGSEVRVVDDDGAPLGPGREGRLQARGPSAFVGYMRRPEAHATDADEWFETGDLAVIDADGYVRISGRSKDLIIRGGENVPVAEVEEVLYRHPAVAAAAVVGMPDPRLGERGCAFIVLKPGQNLDRAGMVAHFEAAKVAKNYWPEHLEIVPDMPRTPSGKIQKFKLREDAEKIAERHRW